MLSNSAGFRKGQLDARFPLGFTCSPVSVLEIDENLAVDAESIKARVVAVAVVRVDGQLDDREGAHVLLKSESKSISIPVSTRNI